MDSGMWFLAVSALGWLGVVTLAAVFRGRFYAIFAAVILSVHILVSSALVAHVGSLFPLFVYLHVAVFAHFVSLVWARLRPVAWRVMISVPAHYFVAASVLGLPWAIAASRDFEPRFLWIPYALAGIGVLQSIWTRETAVDLFLDGVATDELRRHRLRGERSDRPLRIIQITDPHLGPWMSVRRLRRICQRAVDRSPDLILLTGDFLTMESHAHPQDLVTALSPLRAMPGRVFACRGNHDLEAPETVDAALREAGIDLLVDESRMVDTPAGRVEILGFDFIWRARARRMAEVCAAHPRKEGVLRLVLLHDPGAFRHLPEGEGDLVLSGHTHGGQIGLVSLGLSWTPVWSWGRTPDHGFWARGRDRLYVHRGTGHYGFPLRLGVPAEQSIVAIHYRSSLLEKA